MSGRLSREGLREQVPSQAKKDGGKESHKMGVGRQNVEGTEDNSVAGACGGSGKRSNYAGT